MPPAAAAVPSRSRTHLHEVVAAGHLYIGNLRSRLVSRCVDVSVSCTVNHLQVQRDVGLRSLIDGSTEHGKLCRTIYQREAKDGLMRREPCSTACLRQIGDFFSDLDHLGMWTPPESTVRSAHVKRQGCWGYSCIGPKTRREPGISGGLGTGRL